MSIGYPLSSIFTKRKRNGQTDRQKNERRTDIRIKEEEEKKEGQTPDAQ